MHAVFEYFVLTEKLKLEYVNKRTSIKKKSLSNKNPKKTSYNKKTTSIANSFPIVGIGASAGGLEAITELLKNVPLHTGMAFIYVQHLSPDHKSILTSILLKTTSMKVHEVKNRMLIEPENLYVIPPDKEMKVEDGHLKLSARPKTSAVHLSIDTLFSSLAEKHKGQAIGIILSGSASDGTRGMKAIKREGGLTFAQDDSAKFGSMPKSAIASGAVDFILSPKEIALELARLSKHPLVKIGRTKHGSEDMIENDNTDLKLILQYLRKEKGVDFAVYKMNTVKRRIIRRMLLYKIKTLKEYAKLLEEKSGEIDILYQDLLINVTSFFRESDTHKYLKTTFLPKLLRAKKPGETLRIWVPACSTGEEAYSIAMMLIEIQGDKGVNMAVQIFATDLSGQAITKARIGIYSKHDLDPVSPKRLQRFFTKTEGNFRIDKSVRDMCIFATHNILYDPPFSRLDFISCCNLFIYLDTAAQKKALATYHYALNNTGFLMLGKSESIGSSVNLFSSFNKKFKIFSRKNNLGTRTLPALTPRFSQPEVPEGKLPEDKSDNLHAARQGPKLAINGLDSTIDALLISDFTPPSVVISHEMEILQFRGSTDLYLTHLPGKATFNILKMARPEIAFELRNAISKSIKSKHRVRKDGIEIKIHAVLRVISIEVIPVRIAREEPVLLVVFRDQEQTELLLDPKANGKKASGASLIAAKDRRIKKLEEELAAARSDALAFAQEQEAFTEELQSANEEVVSSNEELQSVNEELETSKEEIESVNEELTTTNQELQTRNDLLNESYEYSEAIIATVQEPMIVLDRNFRIKTANKAFYKKFGVKEGETEGELLYDLGNRQWNIPRLRELLEEIIPKNKRFRDFEVIHTFERIGEKVMLLSASHILQKTQHEQLILLSIADITDARRLTSELQEKEKRQLVGQIDVEKQLAKVYKAADAYIRSLFMQAPAPICMVRGPNHVVVLANDMFTATIGSRDITGKPILEALPELKEQRFFEVLDSVYKTGMPFIEAEFPIRLDRGQGTLENGFFSLVCQASYDTNKTIDGIMLYAVEVTDQVFARKKIEESEIRYHNLIYSSPSLIAILRGEAMIVEIANDAFIKQLGNGNNMIGKPYLSIVPELAEQGLGSRLRDVFKTGNPYIAHEMPVHSLRKGTNDVSYFSFIYQPQHNISGEIVGIAILASEVTPQAIYNQKVKEVAEQFQFIADAMPQKVWMADSEGNLNYFNQNWYDFTGLSLEDLKDWGWKQIIHPDDWENNKSRWRHSIDTGTEFELEYRFLNKEGRYKWHLSRGVAFKDETGKVKIWIGTNTEINQQKEQKENLEKEVIKRTNELENANKSLKNKNDTLQKINKELESFTYVSSHDLQEPLRKIQTFTDRITDSEGQNFTEKGRDYFERVKNAAIRMQQLIQDLLAFSRINLAERQLENTDLTALVEDIKTDFKEIIDEKQATIEIQGFDGAKVIPFQFRQLLSNLIGNALKFSKPEVAPYISIRNDIVKYSKPDNALLVQGREYYHIIFTDNGIGIENEFREKIFELFQRLHAREEYPGTGVGLAIVKKIVENHNGVITASGELGNGTRFDIYIPT